MAAVVRQVSGGRHIGGSSSIGCSRASVGPGIRGLLTNRKICPRDPQPWQTGPKGLRVLNSWPHWTEIELTAGALSISIHSASQSRWASSLRVASILAFILGFAYGLALVLGKPLEDTGLSGVVYSFASGASGVVLLACALTTRGRTRIAWSLIGAGILCWGLGEIVWLVQLQGGDIPYPGPADFLYVAGYPLIFAGVVLLPYLRPGRFERIRLGIDAAAGTISLAVVMWVVYLDDVVGLGSDSVETFLNILYPFGDVLLATALMVLAMRRSEQRIDMRIFLLVAGVALTTVADLVFSLQNAAGTYVEWAWLDGLWLFSYGLFALTAWFVTKPSAPREQNYKSVNAWQLIAPYSAVAALFLIRLFMSSGNDLLLNITTTAVAVLLVLRQNVAIRERRELLEQQRDDLVASVSHELRTPLTGIQGYSQLLAESWGMLSDDERQEMLTTINTQANHLGHIVTDLIDVARDRLQNVKLNPSDCSASDLVRDAVAAGGVGRKITVTADSKARVWADPDRVLQVLVNLITNAVRYGRSEVEVVARQGRAEVLFAVHDNGAGVPLQFQGDMWERFERGAHKDDSTVPGSGIGLSVARDLVKAHGGTISYRTSELLGGACFEFSIPVPKQEPAELAHAVSER
jgi:signal transduction histidine kinase